MTTSLSARRIITPLETIENAGIVIRDGVIDAIAQAAGPADFGDAAILPGFVDVHIHGAAGHDVMDSNQAAMDEIGRFLARKGVVAYLATTVTAPLDRLLHALDTLAGIIETGITAGARPIGIHLEGPFISHAKCGVHPTAHILPPSVALFEQMWQASRGQLKLMTIAPELPNAPEVIAHAAALGVRVSLGHSNASLAEASAGIRAGAASATHLFNAMRALDQREPGIIGAALDSDLYCEFIADGIHVDPLLARLLWHAKAHDRIVLITDATSASGMPEGRYRLGDLDVEVANGQCRHEGRLAGSVLTLDRAVSNFAMFVRTGIEDVAALATLNPARLLGIGGYGEIAVGAPAHLAVRAEDGRIVQTLIDGRPMLD